MHKCLIICDTSSLVISLLSVIMTSILFRQFKSKGPEFKGQKLASEKSRETEKTLKRHITVISVYSSILKIARYQNILTRYRKILLYFNVVYRRSMVH